MPRLHQLNKANYPANTEHEILLSLQQNDAILLIEEGVLKADKDESLLRKANSLNIKIYALEQDIKTYALIAESLDIINNEEWLELTSKFEQHTAW